jgi:hypothetical protein
MKFMLEIDCDNSAFEGEGLCFEIARILQDATDRVFGGAVHPGSKHPLRDINGNSVGRFELTETD